MTNSQTAEQEVTELARYQKPDTKEWWRLVRSNDPDVIDLSICDACALQSISNRSLERNLYWAYACTITVHKNEYVDAKRVRAEMEAYLALTPETVH